jgi:hypothetical protein
MIKTNVLQMAAFLIQDVIILRFLVTIRVPVLLIPVTKALAVFLLRFLAMIKMNAPQIPAARFMDANMITSDAKMTLSALLILVTLKLVV